MGKIILIIFILVLALCFCIYNSWFLHEKYKRMLDHEKKKVFIFNSYIAWIIYSLLIFSALIIIIGYEISVLINSIYNMQM